MKFMKKSKFTARSGAIALLLVIVSGFTACQQQTKTAASAKPQLKFHENGTFKIAQFADMHWRNGENNGRIEETLRYVLQTEKPDVAVFTGDNITDPETKEAWLKFISILEDEKMPFAVVNGNHDAEFKLTREEIFDLLEASPYFVGEKGPKDLYGVGTYALPVRSSTSEKPAAVLYCMDSNDYSAYESYSYYDWFHYDQIEWYRQQSKHFTAANGNKPLPALAFFHIPLLEYDNVLARKAPTTVGDYGEPTCPGLLNTGMFAAMVEMGDVMGTFCGHDHSNDFIGLEYGIALAYGRNTNYYKIGSRIIELHENQRTFDTWIRTKEGTEYLYFYPSGISPVDETGLNFLPAAAVNPTIQGANYTYYEGKFESVDELDKATPLESGTTKNIGIDDTDKRDFAYEYRACIKVPEKAVYYFFTNSDDGSKLFIDGKLVVDNDGSHSMKRINGYVPLEAGFHDFKLRYIAAAPANSLEAGVLSRTMRETPLDGLIFINEK
ncbi:metallophosphatase [Bacteroidia bacterium]|nr:metallophosphatase [Bacteroidia bacterium]